MSSAFSASNFFPKVKAEAFGYIFAAMCKGGGIEGIENKPEALACNTNP